MRTAADDERVPPKIRAVRVTDERIWAVGVTWATGPKEGKEDIINLSPLIETRRIYQRLRKKPELFWDVSVVDGGRAIAWFNNSIDMSVAQIEDLWRKDQKRVDLAMLAAGDGSALQIFSVDPLNGLSGTIVTITGVNFTGATEVLFGDIQAAFTIISDTIIMATVP